MVSISGVTVMAGSRQSTPNRWARIASTRLCRGRPPYPARPTPRELATAVRLPRRPSLESLNQQRHQPVSGLKPLTTHMRVLLTNDDGIGAEGLHALRRALGD